MNKKIAIKKILEIDNKVDKDGSKVLSDVNYSATDAAKVAKIPADYNYDAGYDDSEVKSDIATLQTDKADKTYVDTKISGVYHYKGSCTQAELASKEADAVVGDVWNVTDQDGMNVAWTGTEWDNLGSTVDLTSYLTKSEASTTYQAKDANIVSDADYVHTDNNYTTDEKNKLAGIADNANNYVHPTGDGNSHIPTGGTVGQILVNSATGTAVWETKSVSIDVNAAQFSENPEGLFEATINHTLATIKVNGVLFDSNNNEEFCSVDPININSVMVTCDSAIAGTLILTKLI